MACIGLIKEGKIPADNRVALTPAQARLLQQQFPDCTIIVEPSADRCFSDDEYRKAGIEVSNNLNNCEILLGIKEIPIAQLLPDKTYLFFSHTKKEQPYNRGLMQAMVEKKITLIDYECLVHPDGQRLIGFGFFAGIVGAHNGIMAYGNRSGLFTLSRVSDIRDYRELIHTYFGLKLPPLKVVVTGSGRVAHGILEIMNLMDIQEVEPDEFLHQSFPYPVYVHLKGADLYQHRITKTYQRMHFHENAREYESLFEPYTAVADILMNGIYWDETIPRLFSMQTLQRPDFRMFTIADITDDKGGSVPCNLGDAPPQAPVYGVDRYSGLQTAPYLPNSIDVMAVGNLPNELPRDASRYFGEQLIKYVFGDLLAGGSEIITGATMLTKGELTEPYQYLREYAYGTR
ncbi:MAG: alanine dehydrogenase [Sediminibacterium sp.]|nr:alanine dehydrogenase [Sediminibacterium sp.]